MITTKRILALIVLLLTLCNTITIVYLNEHAATTNKFFDVVNRDMYKNDIIFNDTHLVLYGFEGAGTVKSTAGVYYPVYMLKVDYESLKAAT